MRPLARWLMTYCLRPVQRGLALYAMFYVPTAYTFRPRRPAEAPGDVQDRDEHIYAYFANAAHLQGAFEAAGPGWPDHRAR